jgi:hypothetical protein
VAASGRICDTSDNGRGLHTRVDANHSRHGPRGTMAVFAVAGA